AKLVENGISVGGIVGWVEDGIGSFVGKIKQIGKIKQVGKIEWVKKIGWVVKYKIAIEQVGSMIEIVEWVEDCDCVVIEKDVLS
ncbi:25508_t:CDS:2, partial [Gigaspora margarita]